MVIISVLLLRLGTTAPQGMEWGQGQIALHRMMVTTDVSRWRPGRLCMDAGCLSGSGADKMPSFEFFLVVLKLR